MGLIPKIEAAMKLGVSIELIDYFTKICPKSGENIVLKIVKTDLGDMYDETELISYRNYLNKPWPLTDKSKRPPIPEAIKKDIKQESHCSCAICGFMDNGEVAHIDPVASTLNNSPDNLIYLCPNHHTKYDYGYTFKSNVTIDEVKAAKTLKRNARCRILKYEANATKYLLSVINFLKNIQDKLKDEDNLNLIKIYMTEMQKLTEIIPDLAKQSHDQAVKDEFTTKTELALSKHAPELTKFAYSVAINKKGKDITDAVCNIISHTSSILIDIDEVDCPHCGGSGQTGMVGDICVYCGGSCVVSKEKYEEYDRAVIDEVDCPHCGGSGQTGRVGDICAYCSGSCVVSKEEYDEYDRGEIDEVDCPHCGGSGQTGLVGNICALCKGSCVVTQEISDEYFKQHRRR